METRTKAIKEQLVRAFNNRGNNWRYDGKTFSTSWNIMSDRNNHCLSIKREGDTMLFTAGISCISDEWLRGNLVAVVSRDFTNFSEGIEWLAEVCAKNNEAVKSIACDIQNSRSEAFQKLANL